MKKKTLIALMSLLLLISLMPAVGLASWTVIITIDDAYMSANSSNPDAFDVSILHTGDTVIQIATTQPVTLTQSGGAESYVRIDCIISGVDLTLSGVNIDNSSNPSLCSLSFTGSGNSLTIQGETILKSGNSVSGVKVETGTTLSINGNSTSNLTAQGGQYGAGIGGGDMGSSGIITIYGGDITAIGGYAAAGIGGGYNGDCATITISGGDISAISGYAGAGIGGGDRGDGGIITISGGDISAISGDDAAGIGGGYDGDGGTINISGGTVTATGKGGGAGIGGGIYGDGDTILISGKSTEVTATGGNYAAGIGSGGGSGTGGIITISGGDITAKGGTNGAGIGGGFMADGGNITLSGGKIFADGDVNDIGDGGGADAIINISGSSAVFIKNNLIDPVTTSTHTFHDGEDLSGEKAYGVVLPNTWTSGTAYAYLTTAMYTVTYEHDSNSSFNPSDATIESVYGHSTPSTPPSIIPNDGYEFKAWTDGTTTSNGLKSFTITNDTTLTALMKEEQSDDKGGQDTSSKKGNLSGTLFDSKGNPLEGIEVTIHSDPVTTTTNSAGVFSFSNVSYNSHTLYLRNASGTLLEQYALSFSRGSANSASISGNNINITYTNDTASVHMNFQANTSLDGFAFLSASFVSNPITSEMTWFKSLVSTITNWFK